MNPHEIKVGHCYSLSPVNGRRTIARVTNLFRITAMAAYEHSRTETLELNPVMVRFVWRYAAYPTGWSRMGKRLLLEEFVLAAEKEVAST
jgi:undecaprenyl pyrophosphate synthase